MYKPELRYTLSANADPNAGERRREVSKIALDECRPPRARRPAPREWIVHRRAGSDPGKDGDRRGGRAIASADLEREGQECPALTRAHPQDYACVQGQRGHRTTGVPSRKLWHALHEVDNYLRSQCTRLVNYAERYRAGLRVEASVTEGTANFLVNWRMNKSQQMRWSRRGAAAGSVCGPQRRARLRIRQPV